MTLIDKINEVADQYKNQFSGTPESVPDWFIADKINERPSTVDYAYRPVLCNTVKTTLLLNGEYSSIKVLSQDPSINAIKLLCANVIETLEAFNSIDVSVVDYYSGYVNMINGLFSNQIISQKTKDTLMSLLVPEQVTRYGTSWAEENSVFVDSRSIGIARGANPGS